MIPILYEKDETLFANNGLGRLRDCISCKVTEERNGIYECDFEYPMDAEDFGEIQVGRIIGVTHDDAGDLQPFDIVSYSKPINGLVTFHAVHISYRQSYLTASGSNVNSLADAFTLFENAEPYNPFSYESDFSSSAYFAAADGVPRSVRQMMGGIEGSILDSYGGEYEFDRFRVILHKNRGTHRNFTIRYGVNMLDYQDDADYSGTYSSCIPYWTGDNGNGGQTVVKGNRVDAPFVTYNGRNDCVPLDLTDKFETMPTAAQLETMALNYMQSNQTSLPQQTIKVDFIRLQDFEEYADFRDLLQCNLCDTINVAFPRYGMQGTFKIVKTVFDVLRGKYVEMELGQLSTTLAQALGISTTTNEISNGINNLSISGDFYAGGDASIVGALDAGNIQRHGHDYITYKDYTLSITYSAGTVGTRGAEVTENGALANYTPIGISIISGNTYYSSYVARIATGGTITLSAYRATTGARTNDSVGVRVVYRAN